VVVGGRGVISLEPLRIERKKKRNRKLLNISTIPVYSEGPTKAKRRT
jgi:hypothetical protein